MTAATTGTELLHMHEDLVTSLGSRNATIVNVHACSALGLRCAAPARASDALHVVGINSKVRSIRQHWILSSIRCSRACYSNDRRCRVVCEGVRTARSTSVVDRHLEPLA